MKQKSLDLGPFLDLKTFIPLRSEKWPEVEVPDVKLDAGPMDAGDNGRAQFDFSLSTSGLSIRVFHFGPPKVLKTL